MKERLSSILFLLVPISFLPSVGSILTNVALRKPAYIWPRTTAYPGPEVVVDGNHNSNHDAGSCSHSDAAIQNKPWWKVDLGGDYLINNVNILNRGDCVCYSRLSNFRVYVGYDNITLSNNQLCWYQATAVGQGAWFKAVCPQPMVGQFVAIQIMGPSLYLNQQILSLCEVQVFATPLPSSFSRIGRLIARGQRIGDYEFSFKFIARSLLDCGNTCWSSHNKHCVSFSLCNYQGRKWCHIAATFSIDYVQDDPECNTYILTYHV